MVNGNAKVNFNSVDPPPDMAKRLYYEYSPWSMESQHDIRHFPGQVIALHF